MQLKHLLLVLLAALGLAPAWSQSTLLYTATITSPYDSGTVATLQIFGNAGDKVQEKVNYMFTGDSSEVNTVRVDFQSNLSFQWTLSAQGVVPTIQSVYQRLTATSVATLPTTNLSYTSSLALSDGSSSFSITNSTSMQSASSTLGAPWASVSKGVWWADFTQAPNLDAMFAYDAGLATPRLSTYLPSKKIQLQLVKNSPLNVHINQASLNGSTLSTILTSSAGRSSTQPSWKVLNFWVDGVSTPSALSVATATTANGVRSEALSWVYSAGHVYQVQVVDGLGNSQSVWYPKQNYQVDPAGQVSHIVAGYAHSVALKSNGTLWAWGDNGFGQLGDGTFTQRKTPVQVLGLTAVVSVAAGGNHALVLKSDGTVWAWGSNSFGQLGDGTFTNRSTAMPVNGLTGMVSVAAGNDYSLAVKSDGTVWAWGGNNFGQLGDGTTTYRTTAVPVSGLTGVVSVAAGGNHALALKSDGTLWAWGYNFAGQLGDGTTAQRSTPVPVSGLTGVVSVAAGTYHSLALKSDGTVWVWGNNASGQLGDGTTTQRTTAVQVSGLTGVVSVASAGYHSLALKTDHTVWAWGDNTNGQLGDGTTTSRNTAVQVIGLTGMVSVGAGSYHGLAVKSDGTVWALGLNLKGQLGDGTTTQRITPVRTLGLPVNQRLAAGGFHSLAVKSDGTVWAWGLNGDSQLGDGTRMIRNSPVQVSGQTGVVFVAAGNYHSLALKSDGTVWAWGNNSNGQLGDGTTTPRTTAVRVSGLTGVVSVAAGTYHSLALKSDGTVWVWGNNASGQLGDGTTTQRTTAVQVSGLTGVVSVAAESQYSLAVKSDGTVWAWGSNTWGQLGDGTTTQRSSAVQAIGLTGVMFVAPGFYHSLAVKSDGTVWSWGRNDYGQLGDGTTTQRTTAVQVSGLTGVVSVAAGEFHALALKADGTMLTWGNNTLGQLGDGTNAQRSTAVQVNGLTGVVSMAAGDSQSLAVKSDGTVWMWGWNTYGLLGNGKATDSPVPIPVSLPSLQYDNIAPTLTVAQSPLGWTNQSVTLTLVASDAQTDIDETTVAYNQNGTWVNGNQVTLNTNGTVQFRASDLAGNQATTSVAVTTIDTVAPTFTVTGPPSTADTTWVATGASLVDTVSGISPTNTVYWFDSNSYSAKPFTVSSGTITLDTSALLNGTHTVHLSAFDNAGNSTNLSFSFLIDRTGPAITLTAPTAVRDAWTATGVTIENPSGGVDLGSYRYSIAAGSAAAGTWSPFTVSGSAITIDVSSLSEGPYTIYLQAANTAGYLTTVSFPFSIDRTGPTISATVPPYASGAITITGVSLVDSSGIAPASQQWWVDSSAPSAFTVSGGSIVLSGVSEGSHTLFLRVADLLGNTNTVSYPVTVDLTPPTLTATIGSFSTRTLSGSNLVLADLLSGPNPSGLTAWLVQAGVATASTSITADANGAFSISVPTSVVDGPATLWLRGTDKAGNAATWHRDFTLDSTAPQLSATIPAYAKNTLTVTGVTFTDVGSGTTGLTAWFDTAVKPATAVNVSLTGNSFSLDVSALAAGSHQLYLQGTDVAGNATTLVLPSSAGYFVVNRTPPTVIATVSTAAGNRLNGAITTLSSSVGGIASVTWNLANASGTASTGSLSAATGAFSPPIDTSNLEEGSYGFTLTVVDAVGNSFTTASFPVMIDHTAPLLSATVASWANETLKGSSFTFTDAGSGVDNGSLLYWFDSGSKSALSVTSGGFSLPIASSWAEGAHILHIQGKDNVGNEGNASWSFSVDRGVPVLSSLGLTEDGRIVAVGDYLHGGSVALLPAFTDVAPVQYRTLVNVTGTAPRAAVDADWGVASWTDASSSTNLTNKFSGVSYLYVQARDAAGNLSVVTERLVQVDAGAPGATTIRSTTHPFAHAVTDAVAQTTAMFRLSVGSTGPGGLKNFEWKLFQNNKETAPNAELDLPAPLTSGTTSSEISLNTLADNTAEQFYWLAVRAVGSNGKPGAWSLYPFAVNTTPPRFLTVTSSTHPLADVAYQGTQVSFQWNQPVDFTGIKSYYYRLTALNIGDSWTPPSTLDGTWTATGQNSFLVTGLTGSGQVGIAVAAQDWSGNIAYASRIAQYDNVKPIWASTPSVLPDPETRSATLSWATASDDVSTASNGLVYGVKVQDITNAPYQEVAHWQYLTALPSSLATTFPGLVVGNSYLVTVALVDGAGNRREDSFAFVESDPNNAEPVPPYTTPFEQTWGGLTVSGTTTYAQGAITGQTAALSLADSPLSTDPVSTELGLTQLNPSGPNWSAVPDSASAPDADLFWSANGLTGTVHGVALDKVAGLSLGSLTLTLPLADQAGHSSLAVAFPAVSVGPAPGFMLNSATATLPGARTLTTSDGWTVTGVTAAALRASGWSLTASTQALPTNRSFAVTSDAQANQATTLTLEPESYLEGTSIRRAPVQIPSTGLFVTAGGLTIQVIHAAIVGDRLQIAQGFAVIAGLSPGASLELDDVSLDADGRYWPGAAFKSILTGSIQTPYGVLSGDANSFVIQNHQLVLSTATLTRADASVLTVTNAVFDSNGVTAQGGSITGSFTGSYFGFPVRASGGTIAGGVRSFDTASIDLPAFGVAGLALSGLGISLADDHLMISGVASVPASLSTGFGASGVTAASLTLAPSGVSAVLTAALPESWGNTALPLGRRTLASDGSIGADPGVGYPVLTFEGYALQPQGVHLTYEGLVFDELTLNGYGPFGAGPLFEGLTLKADGTFVHPGMSSTTAVARFSSWALTFDGLRLEATGLAGEPLVDLPAVLGGKAFRLGTTTLHADGTFTSLPSTGGVSLDVYGWASTAASLNLEGANFRLNAVTVLPPGLMQSQVIPVGSVLISQTGDLVATDSNANASFRGTNGFRVSGTKVHFDPRGLAMGGQIFLPEAMGGGAVNFADGSIYLEPDGGVLARVSGATVSTQFAGFTLQVAQVAVDRSGLTASGVTAVPLGLVAMAIPDFTVYATGELAVAGQSTTEGEFALAGGNVHVAYSQVRFSDEGVHVTAKVTLPPSWGSPTLDFDDLVVTPEGQIIAQGALHHLSLPLDALGMTLNVDTLRMSSDGFLLDGVTFLFNSGPLASQQLTIDAAKIDLQGNLDLYGFSFAPIDLYGYKVTLTGLSIGPAGLGLSGGIRLSDSLPVPELQGLYLALKKFRVAFDGTIQDFEVAIDEGFSLTVFDSWTLGIQGLAISKNLLTINQATLDLPASFSLPQLSVSGMTIDLQTGAITWGKIAVQGASYLWNGLTFRLDGLTITPAEGLLFSGSVDIPATSPDGAPYPALLQNRTLLVDTLQILPSGLPGQVSATLTGVSGPLFDSNILLSNASFHLDNLNGDLSFGFSGDVKLGASFMAGLAGTTLRIRALSVNVADGTLGQLDVAATAADGLGKLSLPGGVSYEPQSIALAKTGPHSFEVGTTGDFLTGSTFPGALKDRRVAVETFRIESTGTLIALAATLGLPGNNPLLDGVSMQDAALGVQAEPSNGALTFGLTGHVKLGPGFLDGLSGLVLDVNNLTWDGAGTLLSMDVGTQWTGSRTFFGGSTIENGSVSLTAQGSQAWTVGMTGLFRLPSTGLPQGLAGLGMTIQTLKFRTDGTISDAAITSQTFDLDIFGAAQLVGGRIGFAKYDSRSLAINVTGGILLPASLPSGLGGKTVTIQAFQFTTAGTVLDMRASLPLDPIPLFGGITMSSATLGFSTEGVSLINGQVAIPQTMLEGLPTSIALTKILFGWDGKLKDVAAGVGQATVKIAGFTTDITNLVLSSQGIHLDRAVMSLPPNLSSQKVLILNAGFDTSGRFTGTVGVDEVNQTIAGFALKLKTLTLDVSSKAIRVATATIQTPTIGTLNANIQLNAVVISPSGVELGGVGFNLPNFDYGGVGFRALRVSFSIMGSTFRIAGAGQGMLPGLGTLDAELSFTNISSTYPIGLERAYFQYTFSSGIPLGTTGLYLNKIRGGFAYGPPNELPQDLRPLFNQEGPRLQLGIGMSAPLIAMTMDADFWVDVKNGAWAFDGNASVFAGAFTGRLAAGFGNNILYGTFSFAIRFAEGKVQIWIFPYNGGTAMSGRGTVDFIIRKGALASWTWYTPNFWGWDSHSVDIPWGDLRFGGIGAEFGQFNRGVGVKGWVDVPCWGGIGVFAYGGGMDFNISGYSLIKPAGY